MNLFEQFASKKVVVLGDLMLDRYIHGNASRISPEAPVPVVREQKRTDALGGAANVVNNLAGLGAQVFPVGVVGADSESDVVRRLLERGNVDIQGIITADDRPTSLKTRIISGSQHVVRLDREITVPVSTSTRTKLLKRLDEMMGSVDAIIFQDYDKGVLTDSLIRPVLEMAEQAGVLTAVDPKFTNFFSYQGVDLFKPNRNEAMAVLSRIIESDTEVESGSREIIERLKCQNLVITRGSWGMSVFDKAGNVQHIPTEVRDVLDVSGAGDTVISALVLGLLSGMPLVKAAVLANISAGIVCKELGAVPVDLKTLKEKWHDDV